MFSWFPYFFLAKAGSCAVPTVSSQLQQQHSHFSIQSISTGHLDIWDFCIPSSPWEDVIKTNNQPNKLSVLYTSEPWTPSLNHLKQIRSVLLETVGRHEGCAGEIKRYCVIPATGCCLGVHASCLYFNKMYCALKSTHFNMSYLFHHQLHTTDLNWFFFSSLHVSSPVSSLLSWPLRQHLNVWFKEGAVITYTVITHNEEHSSNLWWLFALICGNPFIILYSPGEVMSGRPNLAIDLCTACLMNDLTLATYWNRLNQLT